MTDNQEGKGGNTPPKLTLGSSKLSLNRPVEANGAAKSFVNTSSKTVIEVKKSKLSLGVASSLSLNKNVERDSESSSDEFNKRLNVLKKAAQEARTREIDHNISTLSKLASANQPALRVPEQVEEIEVIQDKISEIVNELPKPVPTATPSVEAEQAKTFVRSPTIGAQIHFGTSENTTEKTTDGKTVAPKVKVEEAKKLKKTDIFNMLGNDETDGNVRTRSLASIKRAKEKERRKSVQYAPEKVYREVIIPEMLTVAELANKMSERGADVVRELMKLGIIATISQTIDADTAELIATTLGHTVKRILASDVENILISETDRPEDLKPRAPIVTIMGHVDHGKTSLLDALKSTDVVSQEAGGITQHIGAYRVTLSDGRSITFIDTPGHEAFSEMRIRGAQVTDIVVIVVAADDGIKAQTIEAINHAKAANVPIIVAVNKIDKPDIDIDRVKNELLMHGLVSEEFGGDTIIIPVSALKKLNLDKLEEAILNVAEMQELTTNPNAATSGVVIEARVDKNRGIVATMLVQRGTLKSGDIVVAGAAYGKIRRMHNDKGIEVHEAEPTLPIEIYGLNEAPQAGDKFNVVQTERQAREITEYRQRLAKEKKVSTTKRSSLEDLFLKAANATGTKDLPIIIKGDVQGSIEAIITSLMKIPSDEIKLKVLHQGVGSIIESDVTLATASNAIILGFNVRANNNALALADKENIDLRYYSIIYNLLDDVKSIMSGMLSPIIREQYIGSVEIRQVFVVSKVGKVAGSYVTKGVIKRGAGVRLVRDNIVMHEGKLKTLKRFKDDVKEVRENFECGIAFENYEDIKAGDMVEVFETIIEKKQLL